MLVNPMSDDARQRCLLRRVVEYTAVRQVQPATRSVSYTAHAVIAEQAACRGDAILCMTCSAARRLWRTSASAQLATSSSAQSVLPIDMAYSRKRCDLTALFVSAPKRHTDVCCLSTGHLLCAKQCCSLDQWQMIASRTSR